MRQMTSLLLVDLDFCAEIIKFNLLKVYRTKGFNREELELLLLKQEAFNKVKVSRLYLLWSPSLMPYLLLYRRSLILATVRLLILLKWVVLLEVGTTIMAECRDNITNHRLEELLRIY
jgi:hypothetical protein